jgi:hypothetical protein
VDIDLRQCAAQAIAGAFKPVYPQNIMRSIAMTQHLLQQDAEEDRKTMRQLATVIGGFIVATAILAVSVGMIMG